MTRSIKNDLRGRFSIAGGKKNDLRGRFFGMVLALILGATGTALACPVCFRVEENATTDGVQVAVLVLVGVTTVVLGAFARFVVLFARREGELHGDERPSEEVVRD
ncbi:MAG TPA: hypothetical protein PKW63_04290 [Vicinamibacterales bacterium]|jgi:heme/copper-type cytochrome/quinol oxidase subunit 2|nr:hypothetical protein [Vicinamibacterales bacterium]